MAANRFLIAPINVGLQKNIKPWLIPDDAFERLQNAFVFRGRVRKRFGSYLMNRTVASNVAQLNSRLRIKLGTTDALGDLAGTVPGAVYKSGQLFSIGSVICTARPGFFELLDTSGSISVAFYNIGTGAYNFMGAPALTDVYFYPAEPVMGLITLNQNTINNELVVGFDTQFSYHYTGGGWERLGTAIWTGDNSQFFWGTNFRILSISDYILFVTNFDTADPMRYWDGTWNNFTPVFNSSGDTINTARLMVSFKNRLLLFNIIENVGWFQNRLRFSQNGSPLQADAWREDIPGKGDFLDAPVQEAVVSVQFLKDRLIVFFEKSTFELVYTGNEVLPFRWQKINTELGAESTFSIVPFDKATIGVGNIGIHSCNGANVIRIDDKIPDEIFKIHNLNEGVKRVYGIRDYDTEVIYWALPAAGTSVTFPNRVLVYNYRNDSWAFNDDSITCFGYYQDQNFIAWAGWADTWEQSNWTWDSGSRGALFRNVIAGNQEGFVFIVDPNTARNAPALQITNITTPASVVTLVIEEHNLRVNDYISIEHARGVTGVNDSIFAVTQIIDADTITIVAPSLAGTYTGGAVATRISRIDILSKQYNFYIEEGNKILVESVDFFVDRTANGQVTVDFFPSSTGLSMLTDSKATSSILGNNVLETSPYATAEFEKTLDRFWHSIYFPIEGDSIQTRIFLDNSQLMDPNIAWSGFELNGMLFHVVSTGRV